MKAGWIKTTVGAAFSTATGGTPPKNNMALYGNFLPLVKPPELRDAELNSADDGLSNEGAEVARIAPPYSILVSCIGNLGKIGLNIVPVAFNQQINAIFPDSSKANHWFMFYQTLSCSFKAQLEALASGTTVPIVNKSKFNSIEIVLPPLPEQQRIVAILDETFEGVVTAKVNAEKNMQNVRTLFASYVQEIFEKAGVGWNLKTLNQIAQNCDNQRIPITKSNRLPGEYPYYGASGIVDYVANYIFDGDYLLVSEDGANLLARSSPIAFSASGQFWVNNHAHILKFESMITHKFVEFYLESIKLDEYITGAAQPKLNQKALNSIPIFIPDEIDAQKDVVQRIESLRTEVNQLEAIYQQKIAALDELKKALLQQAFSGEL